MGTPILKYRSRDKLHITKGPDKTSWCLLFVCAFFAICSMEYIPLSRSFQILWAFGVIIIGFIQLDSFENWVFNKYNNTLSYTRGSWLNMMQCYLWESKVKTIPLRSIVDVQVFAGSLFLILDKNKEIIEIAPKSVDYCTLQMLRYHISSFLQFEEVEYCVKVRNEMTGGQYMEKFYPYVDGICALENARSSFMSNCNITPILGENNNTEDDDNG